MKTPKDLTRAELELLAAQVQWCLWRDSRPASGTFELFWNPDKEGQPDTIEDIESLAVDLGLKPAEADAVQAAA